MRFQLCSSIHMFCDTAYKKLNNHITILPNTAKLENRPPIIYLEMLYKCLTFFSIYIQLNCKLMTDWCQGMHQIFLNISLIQSFIFILLLCSKILPFPWSKLKCSKNTDLNNIFKSYMWRIYILKKQTEDEIDKGYLQLFFIMQPYFL